MKNVCLFYFIGLDWTGLGQALGLRDEVDEHVVSFSCVVFMYSSFPPFFLLLLFYCMCT